MRRLAGVIVVEALAATLASTACHAEVGFYTDKRTGCQFVSLNFHKDATVQWSGACKAGRAEGPGVVTLSHSNPAETWLVEVRIEGTYKEGALNGRALVSYADGSRFEGDFERALHTGRGRTTLPGIGHLDVQYGPNGRIDYVEFLYDKDCRCATPGARYVGAMPYGKRDGKGIMTLGNGDKYEGEWRDDLPDGAGTLTKGGKSYSGRWTAGCSQSGGTTYKFLVTSCSR